MLFQIMPLLSAKVETDPFVIVGPIAWFLGLILNFIFNAVVMLGETNSLGWAIILFTVVARTLMLPIGFKQQKSTFAMRKMQPEVDAIRKKYEGLNDRESQQAMAADTQALYARHKYNPLAGCLPMLITLPIFFALSYLVRQSFLYVDFIGDVYSDIAGALQRAFALDAGALNAFLEVALPKVKDTALWGQLDTDNLPDMLRVINTFEAKDWAVVMDGVGKASVGLFDDLTAMLASKANIESFLGINLVENAGWAWPGITIPILTGVTTFLSTWIINKQTSMASNPQMKNQQMIMLIVMPVMLTWMTAGFSAGVGLYWIVSSIYQTIQQILLDRYYRRKDEILAAESAAGPKPIITVDKSKHSKKGAN
ncbi:MAG: YidC/Oxa1 family membrane protein insertase [Clostridiales bacterium]|jgi:YidC/Oxa1 family membrane protein insertase|nr:YidC/Oxa1 family membrane protein insertase [Clostridiales bacterium]